ncbi:hypothetical protein KIN20_019090 [Parelaphostrongylus tenuis]|uniref:Uncharacterized protein n=1 Tax=Parelaphostrongylus tenuis TaxID=148309 RepID=A0AAD5QUU5_PARTN|nr:hypothetical protein KIN20_019090 [Parelaphostrongylus tenuis]
MDDVHDALEQQARSALALDAVISAILRELNVEKFFVNHEHHHGELVESDVAKCSGQSSTDVGIRSLDVLEQQGRSALLPDAVVSAILGQLNVEISYIPMICPMVTGREDEHMPAMDEIYCIIVGNTVTGVCILKEDKNNKKSVACQRP